MRDLESNYSTFRFVYILNQAFGVPAGNLKELSTGDHLGKDGLLTDEEAADRIGRPGLYSTAEAIELVRPWLVAAGAREGAPDDR